MLYRTLIRVCILLVALLTAACGGGGGGSSDSTSGSSSSSGGPAPPQRYSIGGTVSGLTGPGLILGIDDLETLGINSNGPFTFENSYENSENYHITITRQPREQLCSLVNDIGSITGSDVDDIQVECADRPAFVARSEIMQIVLNWETAESVNVYYSSDADCDWNNYTTCPDGTIKSGLIGGTLTLKALEEGLDPDIPWYFVLTNEVGTFSEVRGARAAPAAVDGPVYTVVANSNMVFAGGEFQRIAPTVHGSAILSGSTGQLYGASPHIDDEVETAISDGYGGWYIGGSFLHVNGELHQRLAHIRADGSVDPAWAAQVNGNVFALALSDETVFVGGGFTQAGDQDRNGLAAFDAVTGALKDWVVDSETNYVLSMDVANGLVYAGGSFADTSYGERRAAAFSIVNGRRIQDWEPYVGGHVTEVTSMAVSGDTVYLGGNFDSVGTVTRRHLAAVDATNGEVRDWNPVVNGQVNDMVVTNDVVYICGEFGSVGSVYRSGFAAIDRVTGQTTDWYPLKNINLTGSQLYALDVTEDTVYAGGTFAWGSGADRDHLVAFDRTSGELKSWNAGTDNTVKTIEISGDLIFASGPFRMAGNTRRSNLAAFDTASGTLEEWNPGADRIVKTIIATNSRVYVGGLFSNVGGENRQHLASFDASTGELNDWKLGANNGVTILIASDNKIYAGGAFSSVYSADGLSAATRHSLAAFNAETGEIDMAWNPGTNGLVDSLAINNGVIYAGGNFTQASGNTRTHLAAFDADTGALNMDWDPGANDDVLALAVGNNRVYAGGRFTLAGGNTRHHLAAFDVATGALDIDWNIPVEDHSGYIYGVNALAVTNGTVYIGGHFDTVAGQERQAFAAVDELTGSVLNWNQNFQGSVDSFFLDGNILYAGGSFTWLDSQKRHHFLALDITDDEPVW